MDGLIGAGSDHVLRIFAAYDALAVLPDASSLLRSTFLLVQNHQLAQRLVYCDSTYSVAETTISPVEGIGLPVSIPAAVLPIVLRLDGERSLETLIDEVAAEAGMPGSELSPRALQTVRELLTRGLIAMGDGARS